MADRRRGIVWSQAAARDLEEIAAHVARESPATAERLVERLWSKAESLRTHARRGRIVAELLQLGMSTWRELVVPPYRLVYRIGGSRAIVLGVFDGRRDLQDVLLERLVRDV